MLLEKRTASQVLEDIYGSGDLAEEMAEFALRTQSSFKYDCVSKKVICVSADPSLTFDSLPTDLVSDHSLKITLNKTYSQEDINRQHFSRSMPHMFTKKIIEVVGDILSKKKSISDKAAIQKSLTPANLRKRMFEEAYLRPNGRKMLKENPKLTKKFSNLVNKIKTKHFKNIEESDEAKTASSSNEITPEDINEAKNYEGHHKEKILVDKFYVSLASRLSKVYTQRRIFGGNMEIYDRSFLC